MADGEFGGEDLVDECTVWGVSSAPCSSSWTCDAIVDCGFTVVDCDQTFIVSDLPTLSFRPT